MTHAMILAVAAGPFALAQPPADPLPAEPAPPPADGPVCWPDCNADHRLDVNDFICFQAAFAFAGCTSLNDCDNNGCALNVLDFICFMQRFAAGCSAL